MEKYIIAMDQGTTSSRAILFNKKGQIISSAQKEFTQIFPKPGWVEHNPFEIWSSQLSVTMEAIGKIGATYSDIAAIGITNQRETTIIWDKKTGHPVYNAICWQCRRTAGIIEKLKKDGMADYVRDHTGLIPDAYYSASKIAWILENVAGVRERAEKGELLFGTVDSWLIWNLTKGSVHVTDYTNASRTMMFDIYKKEWDKRILEYFRIPECMLPELMPSSYIYGYTSQDILGGRIPISGAAGDQQAALFGQCCFEKGDMKNTYGTGCFMLMNTGNSPVRSESGLISTICAGEEGEFNYALEGSVFTAGAAVQWLRDSMEMIRSSAMCEEYCTSLEDTGGVYVVPAFSGLGAPYWNQYARGAVFGITRASTKAQLIRATVESIAYQSNELIGLMEKDGGIKVNELKVDGGASANNFLMQFQADLNQKSIVRPECIETTGLGAAYLAGLAVKYWDNKEEIMGNWRAGRIFRPEMDINKRDKLLRGWKRAVKMTLSWAEYEDE